MAKQVTICKITHTVLITATLSALSSSSNDLDPIALHQYFHIVTPSTPLVFPNCCCAYTFSYTDSLRNRSGNRVPGSGTFPTDTRRLCRCLQIHIHYFAFFTIEAPKYSPTIALSKCVSNGVITSPFKDCHLISSDPSKRPNSAPGLNSV